MDKSVCITNGIWTRHAEGKLSASETAYLQKHVKTCEMCRDIREGIDGMADPGMLQRKVSDINRMVDERLKSSSKQRMILWWYGSAAAVVCIAIGLSWLLFKGDDKNMAYLPGKAEQKDPVAELRSAELAKPVEEETLAPASTGPAESPKDIVSDDLEQELPPPYLREEARTVPEKAYTDAVTANSDTVIVNSPAEAKDRESESNTEKKKEELSKANIQAVQAQTESYKNKTDNKQTRGKIKRETYPSNAATNDRNIVEDDHFAGVLPPNDSLNYNNALRVFEQKQYDPCLGLLQDIINDPASPFYEDGLILKAKALIGKDRKLEARQTLDTVIALKGKRMKEAEALRKTVK